MKNLMDVYIEFTEKKIKKYMKIIFNQYYDEKIVSEYLKTYVNARYYNIQNAEKPARAFYLRILDELEYKEDILMKKCEEETETLDEKQYKLNLINIVKQVFGYILFFIKEIITKIIEMVQNELKIKNLKKIEEILYKEITNDILSKDIFLDKFDTDEFLLKFENSNIVENLYYVQLDYNIKMPMQYSEEVIEKVFREGIVAEDKLNIEYLLLSIISIRDVINGNFNDKYIAEFTPTLFKKKQKLDGILSIIGNQALQDKISLNIIYSDYIKNQKSILEYTKKGYDFTIILDDSIKSIEDVEKLKMFKIVIAPRNIKLYKEIKNNKSTLSNVIYK